MNRDALSQLPRDDLIALILSQADVIARQAAQIEVLTKRVEELEAKLGKPPKTPDNSSVPPSQGTEAEPGRTARRKEEDGAPWCVSRAERTPRPGGREAGCGLSAL